MKTNVNEITELINNLIVPESDFTNKTLFLNQEDLSQEDIQRQADTLREANLWMWDEARGKFESLIYNVVLELETTTTDEDTGEISTTKTWSISDVINYKKGVLGFLSEQGQINEDGEVVPFLNPTYVRYWIDAMIRLSEYWFSNGFTLSTEPSRTISHDFADSSLHSVQMDKDESGMYMPVDVIRSLELGQFHNWKVEKEVWSSDAYYEEWVTRPEYESLRTRVATLESNVAELNNAIHQIVLGKVSSNLISIADEDTEMLEPPVDDTGTVQQALRQIKGRLKDISIDQDGKWELTVSNETNTFTLTLDPTSGEIDFDGLKGTNLVVEQLGLLQDDTSAYMLTFEDTDGEVKTTFNGVAQVNVENLFVGENTTTTYLTIDNTAPKRVIDIDTDEDEDTNNIKLASVERIKGLIIENNPSTNDKEVRLTSDFGSGNIDPADLRSFLDWFVLRVNGGVNETNKLNFYFNDNGELELRNDTTPIMIFENGKVNYLNQGLELLGDTSNPLSALNASQIKTLVDQLIASANLTEDKVNYVNNTISVNTDANTNQYITYTPVGVNYFDRAGDTSEFITCGPDNFVASDIQTNMLGFELLFGGEFFNNQLGVSGQGNAWSEYLIIPTIALNKSVDYQVVHNIKGKKTNGEFFVKTKIELDMRYVLVNVDNKYQLEFGEFVNYSLITYNENGTINKTQTGTHYLNDSNYTYDKQPLRLELGGTGYTTIGSGSADLSNYYTKTETDSKLKEKFTVEKVGTLGTGKIAYLSTGDIYMEFIKPTGENLQFKLDNELQLEVRLGDKDNNPLTYVPTKRNSMTNKDYVDASFRKLAKELGLSETRIIKLFPMDNDVKQ